MDSHALLQGIFLTQGLNSRMLGFLHQRAGTLPLAPAEGKGTWADLGGRNSRQRVEADRQTGEPMCPSMDLEVTREKAWISESREQSRRRQCAPRVSGFCESCAPPLPVFQDVIETGFQGFCAALGSEDLWGVKGLPSGFPWLCGPLLPGPSTPDCVRMCLALPVRPPAGRNLGRACVCSRAGVLCLCIRKTL